MREHPRRHVVVVMDQAKPHTSKMTKAFIESKPRLHVFYLPPYSPDWNPDEKVWNYLKNHELKAHRATNQGLRITVSPKYHRHEGFLREIRGPAKRRSV